MLFRLSYNLPVSLVISKASLPVKLDCVRHESRSHLHEAWRRLSNVTMGSDESLDGLDQHLQMDRFAHILGCTGLNTALAVARHGQRRERNDRHGVEARILSQVRDRLQAVHPWHLNVHQDKGWVDFLCFCDGFQPIVSDHHYPSQTK